MCLDQEPKFKERLTDLEFAIGKLQVHLKAQVCTLLLSSGSEGDLLDSINNGLVNLKKEFDDSSEGIDEFKEDVSLSHLWRFRTLNSALEIAVKKFSPSWVSNVLWTTFQALPTVNVVAGPSLLILCNFVDLCSVFHVYQWRYSPPRFTMNC